MTLNHNSSILDKRCEHIVTAVASVRWKGNAMSLLDGFQKWDRRSAPRVNTPMVTVQQGGLFSLNKAATEAIGSPERVELFFNPEKQVIAFVPTDANNINAYPPRQQGSQANYYVAGQKFTRFHGIDTTVARRYAATVEEGILFLDLKSPSTIATGARARSQQSSERGAEQQRSLLDSRDEKE